MKTRNILTSLIVSMFFFSCEKELGIELPFEGKKLVLFSLISPDKVVSAKVGQTYPTTGKYYFEDIENAQVLLYENGVFIEKLKYLGKGEYASATGFKPQVGESYSLKVSAEGFETIQTATEKIPENVVIKSYDFNQKITSKLNKSAPTKKFILSFEDLKNKKNIYEITINSYVQNRLSAANVFNLDRENSNEDLCGLGLGNSYFAKDVCFENTIASLNFGVELYGTVQPDETNNEVFSGNTDKIIVSLRNVSDSYFEFYRSGYFETGFLQVFNPPIQRFSNNQNGYGIFGTYNETRLELKP